MDIGELVSIAGQRDRVFYAENFEALPSLEDEFVTATRISVGPCVTPTERK